MQRSVAAGVVRGRPGRTPVLAVVLLAGGALGLAVGGVYLKRRLTTPTTVDALARGQVPVGQAVAVPRAWAAFTPSLAAPEYAGRDPKRQRAYRWATLVDPSTRRRLLVLYWRTTFLESVQEEEFMRAEFRGTLRRVPEGSRPALAEAFGSVLPERGQLALYLDEMEFPSVSVAAVAGMLLALAALATGAFLFLAGRAPGALAPPAATASAPAARSPRPQAAAAPAEKTWGCPACAAEVPVTLKNCPGCRAPLEVEYYVAAALPFDGFERFVPVISSVLRVNEYQATQPLARAHTPIPYHHLDGFHARGGTATAPFRLAGRGIPSLVTARALAAGLEEKGVAAFVIGSDELVPGPFPRKATGLSYDEDAVTFRFEQGGEAAERTVRWSAISLVLFSAAVPLRGTMTIARDLRDGTAADPAGYLIDLYERGNPEAIRIAADAFYRWEFLKAAASERPADRFGRLMELLEARARAADLQYLTGIYRGPSSEWRMNFYSRFAWLTGEKAGWAKQEGPPKLEGYEVLEKLGEGGMGAVYRARQRKLGRTVALKVIAPHLGAQPKFVARFQAEARAVAALTHPNIVQVIDLVEEAGRHFIVMEFVDGQTLLHAIKKKGRLPEVEGLRVAIKVARALDHAWKRGIIHRDVKPENVFLGRGGEVKLADWGLAKDLEQDLGLTDTGTAVGTPYYMSPEQAQARDLDVRSDLYALGASLFHAIAGQPPFRGSSPIDVISKHLSAPPPDIRQVCPDVTGATAELIRRLMAKRREDRFRDAAEAVAALEAALQEAHRAEVVIT